MGRHGKRSSSGSDIVARLILGTGILVSGAALAVWIFPMGRSAPPPTPPPTPVGSVTLPADPPKVSTADPMAAYFAALPTPTPSTPSLDLFAGTWTATVVSVDVDWDAAPIRAARGQAPFRFTIRGDQMTAVDGRGQPRTLTAQAGEVVARGEGAPDVHLKIREGRLIGFISTDRPAKGRIEFHGTKDP